jgi:hypothetical protein
MSIFDVDVEIEGKMLGCDLFFDIEEVVITHCEPWDEGADVKLIDGRRGHIDGPDYLRIEELREDIIFCGRLIMSTCRDLNYRTREYYDKLKKTRPEALR